MSEKNDMSPPEEAKEKILHVLNEAAENKRSYTYEELHPCGLFWH